MADVEQRAEAEAEHKGLQGSARRAYVGGVFNRIRQAHARATAPGKGARMLKRSARKEARQEAKNRNERRKQLAAQERLKLRARTHREEPRGQQKRTSVQSVDMGATKAHTDTKSSVSRKVTPMKQQAPSMRPKLVPIKQLPGFQLNATRTLDPDFVREYFGEHQMRTAFELQTPHNLKETIKLIEKRTGKRYSGSQSKAAMVEWILANG